MRITCPSCSSEYEVPNPPAAGRAVRCARCSTKWIPDPDPAPITPTIAEPEPNAAPSLPESDAESHPGPSPSLPFPLPMLVEAPLVSPLVAPLVAPPLSPAPNPLPLSLAWAGSAVLIVLLVAAAVVWRTPIMHGWPPITRLYAALGLQ